MRSIAPLQPEPPIDDDVTAHAVLVALTGHRAERELEVDRQPFLTIAREVLEPCMQVAPDRRELVLPHALDGGHQFVVRATAHLLDRLVEHGTGRVDRGGGHRQRRCSTAACRKKLAWIS